MQRVKCEQTAGSSSSAEQPARKLHKALNFSIASIMQSADDQDHDDQDDQLQHRTSSSPPMYPGGEQQCRRQQMFAADRKNVKKPARSPSASPSNLSSGSEHSSAGSYRSSSEWPKIRAGGKRKFGEPPLSCSPSESDEERDEPPEDQLSRVSTPISPGGNPDRLEEAYASDQTVPKLVGSDSAGQASGNHNQAGGAGKRSASGATGAPKSERDRNHSTTNQLLRQKVCHDPRLAPIECHLDNLDLWLRFHPLDTEMIITKQGR